MSDLNEYQNLTEETAVYPNGEEVRYLTLGLVGETGEVAEKVKKWRRGDTEELDTDAMRDELGDVLWYLARLADECDLTLQEIAERNIDKLFDRDARDQIRGDGDDR